MQEVVAVYTDSVATRELVGETRFLAHGEACDFGRALAVVVRAYGTQRGGLREHIEEAIESALRTGGAGAAGIGFDHDEDARLSDELFRARRVGHGGIALRLVALRALCAPVGGLDAADARTIAFYARATADRPLVLAMDEVDRSLPAFVIAKPLDAILSAQDDEEEESEPAPVVDAETELEEAPSISLAQLIAQPPELESVVEHALAHEHEEPRVVVTNEPVLAIAPLEVIEAPIEARVVEPVNVDPTNGRWRSYADALDAARGPQTLASFERLFMQIYLPLASAVDGGLGERRAAEARDEFRRNFSRAYSEALPTFALTGKRPRMVLDAFDVAAKMARAHNARLAQVLLVDGMRFDLAARVTGRTAELTEGRATLADRITLFSALPSSTPRQLELLARGVDALRAAYEERDTEPMRGRTADAVRRVRVGSRDLYKLDLVETTLAAAGTDALASFDTLVEDAARAVAKHVRAQSGRTLVFVLGDHGFRFDDHGGANHGGASPEEVIVSGHAFLVGDLH